MKVKCMIRAMIEREVEVDDEFLPLCDDDFWTSHYREAMNLSECLRKEVESNKLLDNEEEIIYIEDINGNIIFE